MTWQGGFDFRNTQAGPASFGGDPADCTYVLPTDSYPTTRTVNGVSITFGWEDAGVQGRDRSASVDVRLAGQNFPPQAAGKRFRVDLPATGSYKVRLAAGDVGSAPLAAWDIQDNTTVLAGPTGTNADISANTFNDATGTNYSAANWPANNSFTGALTFSTTTFRLVTHYATDITCVAHLYIQQQATSSFTASPTAIPKGHAGNITLTLVGTGTSWTGGTTFTPSGVTGVTKVSQNVTDGTHATLVVTTGSGTGTLTISDGTLTQTVTVGAASFTLSPTSGAVGSTQNVTATGTNTVWTQETAATLFSLAGGTGAAINSITVNTDTNATINLTNGSSVATLTLTDTPTGDTQTFSVTTVSGTITVTAPVPFQTFQRSGTTGPVVIAGTYTGGPGDLTVEASFNGGAYAAIGVASAGAFSGTLPNQAQGQGTLTVRFRAAPSINTTVANVGIGEVFVIAGESTADGRLTLAQSYSHASLHATCYEQGGNVWKDGADPTSASVASGSLWPLLASYVMNDQSVPCAFVTYGVGSTYIVSDWLPPSGGRYSQLLSQIGPSGINGARAVILLLGENDGSLGTSRAVYESDLILLADSFAANIVGAPPTFIYQIADTDTNNTIVDGIRLAQAHVADLGNNAFGLATMYDQSNAVHPTSGGNPDAPIGVTWAARIWAGLKAKFWGGAHGRGPKAVAAQYDPTRTTITVSFDQALKTGLTLNTALWAVSGNGSPATISSIAYASDPNSLTLTLSAAAALPILVSYGLLATTATAGKQAVMGPDISTPGGLSSPYPATIQLPAEPFSGLQAAAASGSGGGGGGGGYYGG